MSERYTPGERLRVPEHVQAALLETRRRVCEQETEEFFVSHGYDKVTPEPLVPREDPTLLFTNSAIAVMKPYLSGTRELTGAGIFVNQPCVRTHNLDTRAATPLKEYRSEYSLFFHMLGSYTSPDRYTKAAEEIAELLFDHWKIDPSRLRVLAHADDKTLTQPWMSLVSQEHVVLNSQDESFYRWGFGLEGVSGRGLTFAMDRPGREEPAYIGNVIEVVRGKDVVGYGLGLGEEVYVAAQYGYEKPIAGATISRFIEFDNGPQAHMADLLSFLVAVYREGVRPGARGREQLVRDALMELSRVVDHLQLSMHACRALADQFEKAEFGAVSDAGKALIADVKTKPFETLKERKNPTSA